MAFTPSGVKLFFFDRARPLQSRSKSHRIARDRVDARRNRS
jgi:hypothetical protein